MPRQLACPRDQTPLVSEPLDGVTVDTCPTCHGLWLDAAELKVVIDAEAARADEPPAPGPWEPVRYLACPACRAQMARRNYLRVSGVIVDTCAIHGTWLDGGELARIAAFLHAGGQAKVERAEEQFREEYAESRRDLDRIERAGRLSRPGAWGADTIELMEVLDTLARLRS